MKYKWEHFIKWYLDRFTEYRRMAKYVQSRDNQIDIVYKELRKTKELLTDVQCKFDSLSSEHSLLSTRHQSLFMESERAKSEVNLLTNTYQGQIDSMKRILDWFGLESRNRSIFGLAPPREGVTVTSGDEERLTRGVPAREMSRRLTEEFLAQVEKSGQMEPPPSGPEFSSGRAGNPVI